MTTKLDHQWTYREVDGNVADQGASSPDMEVISDEWRLAPFSGGSSAWSFASTRHYRGRGCLAWLCPTAKFGHILFQYHNAVKLLFLPKSVIRVVANGEALQDFYSVTVHPCTNHVHERHYHT